MKKFLFLLLLIPLSISAKGIEVNIECDNLKINDRTSCNLVLTNEYGSSIKSVEIGKNNLLLNLKSDYELINEDKLLININSNESKITILSFEYFMDRNDINIYLNNIIVNTDYNTYETKELVKNLKINNIAHVDNILINNQPIPDFDQNKFNYVVNLYELNDYVELNVITDNKNKADIEKKLIKIYNNNTISFNVENNSDSEKYEIKFVYHEENENSKIIIDELKSELDRDKKYHYLEVENATSELIINGETYNLVVGKNTIRFKNIVDTYLFVVNRLKPNEKVESDPKITSLKIGNSYLNIKDDVYNYNYTGGKVDIVKLVTQNNNDYEIKYNDDKITIVVYDSRLNFKEYTIILDDNSEQNIEIKNYDKTKTLFVFFIFLFTFILVILMVIKKSKKEHIN